VAYNTWAIIACCSNGTMAAPDPFRSPPLHARAEQVDILQPESFNESVEDLSDLWDAVRHIARGEADVDAVEIVDAALRCEVVAAALLITQFATNRSNLDLELLIGATILLDFGMTADLTLGQRAICVLEEAEKGCAAIWMVPLYCVDQER
jgi:hypothetical protein